MRIIKRLQTILGCILILRAMACARSLDAPPNATDGLLASLDPQGPKDFFITLESQTSPLRRDTVFRSALRVVAQQTKEDFHGQLPDATTTIRNPQYPGVIIGIISTEPNLRVQRRYVLWGIARVMHHMIRDNAFLASVYILRWRGANVGLLTFFAETGNQLNASYKEMASSQPGLDLPDLQRKPHSTAVSVGVTTDSNEINYDFHFGDHALRATDVLMGTIGGLIRLAEEPDRTFQDFTGRFPGYGVITIWQSVVQPSRMTKNVLHVSMLVAVAFALNKNDWHELTGLALLDGMAIARGGYTAYFTAARYSNISSV